MGSGCNWRIGVCADVPLYLGQKDITNPYFIFHNPAYPIVSHAHGWLYVVQALILVFLSITVLELFSLYIGTARRLFTDKKEQEFNRDTLNRMMDYLTKECSTADARKLMALTKSKSEKRLFVNQLENLGSPHKRESARRLHYTFS